MPTILLLTLPTELHLCARCIKHATCALLLFLCQNASAVQLYRISGDSMLPTLKNGDRIAVDSTCLEADHIAKGQMVLIQLHQKKHPFVKRVIAEPGDQVEIQPQQLSVAGVTHTLKANKQSLLKKQLQHYDFVIPQNSYIALGDNRTNSFDSYALGLITKRQIIGCVVEP